MVLGEEEIQRGLPRVWISFEGNVVDRYETHRGIVVEQTNTFNGQTEGRRDERDPTTSTFDK